jgi:hypothetical protein
VHCAFVVQVLLQVNVVASQRPGAQLATAGVTHSPEPLHSDGGVLVDVVAQAGGMHWVLVPQRAHCPAAH